MFAQFILLVWSAEIFVVFLSIKVGSAVPNLKLLISKNMWFFLLALLFIGLTSTSADLFYLRFYFVLNDQLEWFHIPEEGRPDRSIGFRTYDLRQAYCYIRSHYPLNAVVQHNPNVPDVERASALYAFRQTAILDALNPAFSGVSQKESEPVFDQITMLFEDPSIVYTQVMEICARYRIDLLVVKDLDENSHTPQGWVSKRKPVFQNPLVGVFECSHR
jgi:hypothetical protein